MNFVNDCFYHAFRLVIFHMKTKTQTTSEFLPLWKTEEEVDLLLYLNFGHGVDNNDDHLILTDFVNTEY